MILSSTRTSRPYTNHLGDNLRTGQQERMQETFICLCFMGLSSLSWAYLLFITQWSAHDDGGGRPYIHLMVCIRGARLLVEVEVRFLNLQNTVYWDLPGTIGDCRAVLGFTEHSWETSRKVRSDEKWNLQARKLPVKGTSEIERTHECPANCLVHVWARKVVNCGISFDGRFATPATSIQLPNCSYLQNFWIIVSDVLCLQVHVRMRDNQRSGGRLAAYNRKLFNKLYNPCSPVMQDFMPRV